MDLVKVAHITAAPDYELWAPAETADPGLALDAWPAKGYIVRNPAGDFPFSLSGTLDFGGNSYVTWMDGWRDRAIAAHNAHIQAAAARRSVRPAPQLVEADCGHQVSKTALMSGSRGTSCPDCYDRMSG